MKKEISRIEPWSAVRIGFFFGLLSGFLFGIFSGYFSKMLADALGVAALPPDAQQMAGLSAGAIIALAILMGLIFSLVWAVLFALGAMFYNMIARLFGGIEFVSTGDEAPTQVRTIAEGEESEHE